MPEKPARPLTATVFPAKGAPWLKLESLPTDKLELEKEVARRFAHCLSRFVGETHSCVGDAPEPGDVYLQIGPRRVLLQLGEVVDSARIRTSNRRLQYGTALWAGHPELLTLFAGVQVALSDLGEAHDLPQLSSKQGRRALADLQVALTALAPVVASLPDNSPGELKGLETVIRSLSASISLRVRLLRYSRNTSHPPKWIWTGGQKYSQHAFVGGFRDLLTRKAKHYGPAPEDFWLVLYSIDSPCGAREQNELVTLLQQAPHPFARVYLFAPFPETFGWLRIVYPHPSEFGPPVDAPEPREKKLLMRFLPQDLEPKWSDPRWRNADETPT